MQTNLYNSRKDMLLARFKQNLVKYHRKRNPIITETNIRGHIDLTDSSNTYEVNLNFVQSNHPQERKLIDSEIALPFATAFMLQKYDPTTEGAQTDGNLPMYTWPDPTVFLGVDGSIIEEKALWLLYNGGEFDIVSENDLIVKGQQLIDNLFIPQSGEFGGSDGHRGFSDIGDPKILFGGNNNKLVLRLGRGISTLIQGGKAADGSALPTRNRVLVFLKSFVCHGDMTDGGKAIRCQI